HDGDRGRAHGARSPPRSRQVPRRIRAPPRRPRASGRRQRSRTNPMRCVVSLMLLVTLALPTGCSRSRAHAPPKQAQAERKPLYYRAPMNPAETSPVPKKDEMGMDYVPVYAEKPGVQSNVPGQAAVTLSVEKRRLIGLTTAQVHRGELETTI